MDANEKELLAKKEGFVLYKPDWDIIKDLPDEDRLALYDAIFIYQTTGEILELPMGAKVAFRFIKKQFDFDSKKYLSTVERNRENGKKGGRPKNKKGKPKNPVGSSRSNNDYGAGADVMLNLKPKKAEQEQE